MWTPLDLVVRILQSLQLKEPNESRTHEEEKGEKDTSELAVGSLHPDGCLLVGS